MYNSTIAESEKYDYSYNLQIKGFRSKLIQNIMYKKKNRAEARFFRIT